MKGLGRRTTGRGALNERKQEGRIQVPSHLTFVLKKTKVKASKKKKTKLSLGSL